MIVVKKSFQNWDRKIKTTGGQINLKTELEEAAPCVKPSMTA